MPNTYVDFMPYDQQMAELQRRQRMAELMAQQANAPLETPQGGRMVAKVSPLAGLAKLRQAYNAGSEQRGIEKQRGEAEQQARTGAMDWLDKFSQGKAAPMSPDQALQASLSATPTEAQRVPFTPNERNTELMRGAIGANPYTSKLASALMAQKPATAPVKEVEPDKYTPESIMRFTQSAQSGTPDYSLLVPKAEKLAAKPADIQGYELAQSQGYKGTFEQWHGKTNAAQEPLVSIVGPDGQPIYVNRSQALGKKPYTGTTLKQDQQELDKARAQNQATISAQETLDNAAILLQHPGRTAATGKTAFIGSIPGTDAYDFAARLNSFKAQTFIPMVSALKGMGALSDAEGKKLSESVGALDRSMSETAFEESLKQIIASLYNKAKANGLNVSNPIESQNALSSVPAPPPGFQRQQGGR